VEGRAEVSAQIADGSRQLVAILEQGTVLGEQSFLDGLPRSAQVTSLTDCVVRTLSAKDFRALREADPSLALDLVSDLGRIVSLRSRRLLSEMQSLH
jgi:CRP-like cAMP-binding protein